MLREEKGAKTQTLILLKMQLEDVGSRYRELLKLQ